MYKQASKLAQRAVVNGRYKPPQTLKSGHAEKAMYEKRIYRNQEYRQAMRRVNKVLNRFVQSRQNFNVVERQGRAPSRQNVKDKAKRAIDLWDNLRIR